MNHEIEAMVNPKTPTEWIMALNNPYSPLAQELNQLIDEQVAHKDILLHLIECWIMRTRQEDIHHRAAEYKQALAISLLEKQTLLHNSQVMSQSGDAIYKDELVTDKAYNADQVRDMLTKLEAKVETLRNEIKNTSQELNVEEKALNELAVQYQSDCLRTIETRRIQAVNGSGVLLSVDQTLEVVKNALVPPPPITKMIVVNPDIVNQSVAVLGARNLVMQNFKVMAELIKQKAENEKAAENEKEADQTFTMGSLVKAIKDNPDINKALREDADKHIDATCDRIGKCIAKFKQLGQQSKELNDISEQAKNFMGLVANSPHMKAHK